MAVDESYPDCLIRSRLTRPHNDRVPPDLPKNSSVALCETAPQVSFLIQSPDLGSVSLIALTPQAACQCHMQGVCYSTIEDFFDVTAFRDADEPMLALQSRWADQVDSFIWAEIPEFEQYQFRPAGEYFFFLKCLIDMLYRAAFELAHLFLAAGTRDVIHFEDDRDDEIDHTLFFNGSVYRLILPILAEAYGANLTLLAPCADNSGGDPGVPREDRPNLRELLKQILPEETIRTLWRIKQGGLMSVLPRVPHSIKETTEIVCCEGYEVDFVMEKARRQGWRVTPAANVFKASRTRGQDPNDLISRLGDLWPRLKAQEFFLEPFRWLGVDLSSAAETRMGHWLNTVVPIIWKSLLQARSYFQAHHPDAVLTSSPWKPEQFGMLRAARSLGIPTIIFQHGAFEGSCEYTIYDMTDMRHADYFFVYGDGIAAYLRERAERLNEKRAEIVAVGSPRLDSMMGAADGGSSVRKRLGVSTSERMVLYLPTAYQHNWYMSREAYLGPMYFQLLIRVVDLFSEFPEIRFVYKPFPDTAPDPIARVIGERLPNCTVVTDISPLELMRAGDAIVIDLPSTALVEALLTPKPVLVLADSGFITLRPEARTMLEKRVTLAETPDDFLTKLRIFLSSENFPEPPDPDRSYLRSYGTHLDDGLSAERALAALTKLIEVRRGVVTSKR